MVKSLKDQADRRHRLLQRERMHICEDEVGASPPLTPDEVLSKVRQLGLSTPPGAAATIRKDRDGR
jgi:hypothetical protein